MTISVLAGGAGAFFRAPRRMRSGLAEFQPDNRRFYAIIDRFRLWATSLSRQDQIRSCVENQRQADVLTRGTDRYCKVQDEDFLPNFRWNWLLEKYQKLVGRRDPHFRRLRENWFDDEEKDVQKRLSEMPEAAFDGTAVERGIVAKLRSSAGRGFGFVNAQGRSVAYSGHIHFTMVSGLEASSCLSLHRSFHGAEQVFIDVRADPDRMDLLHEELSRRPMASVGLDLRFEHLRRTGRLEPATDQRFYIPRHALVPIHAVSIHIKDGGWERGLADARSQRFGIRLA